MTGFRQYKNIIGVIGSGTFGARELTTGLGQLIARLGCHLLTGGGGGIMEEVSQDFAQSKKRKGLVIGIIRSSEPFDATPSPGRRTYHPARTPNAWVEIPIFTHLHLSSKDVASRNPINILSSKVVIALPGERGTRSEVELALEYQIPIVFYLGTHRIDGLRASDFIDHETRPVAKSAQNITEVEAWLLHFLT